jgi:hypothetical protein
MRSLAVVALLAFTSAPAIATDKDEDKAKEVAVAFLKAVKAKDLDAVMKTVDVPFAFDLGRKSEPVTKPAELRDTMNKFLGNVTPDKVPTEVGKILNMAAVRELLGPKDEKFPEFAEKMAGKTGYMVTLVAKNGAVKPVGVLVRVKDGKAAVVGIPK